MLTVIVLCPGLGSTGFGEIDAESQWPPDCVLTLSEICSEFAVLLKRGTVIDSGDVPAFTEMSRLFVSREKSCAWAVRATTARIEKANSGISSRRIGSGF